MGSWSLLGIGALCLFGFAIFDYLKIFATLRAILAFTGTILVGSTGWVGAVLHWCAQHLADVANWGTNWALGVGVGGSLLTLGVGAVFIYDLWPKHTTGRRTGFAGVVLAALLLAGVSGIPALNGIAPGVRHGVTTVRTIKG